jgi:hypothetical protein
MRRRPPLAQIIDTRVTWHAEDGVLHGRIVIASVHGHHDATVAVTVI